MKNELAFFFFFRQSRETRKFQKEIMVWQKWDAQRLWYLGANSDKFTVVEGLWVWLKLLAVPLIP